MTITTEDVRRVSALAALDVAEADLEHLTHQLAAIVDYVGQLRRPVPGPAPDAFAPGPEAAPLRADAVRPEPMARAPAELGGEFRDGFFLIPRLEGKDGG